MDLRPRLELRPNVQQQQTLRQTASPKIIQSVGILQLTALALQDRILAQVSENPALELTDDPDEFPTIADAPATPADGPLGAEAPAEAAEKTDYEIVGGVDTATEIAESPDWDINPDQLARFENHVNSVYGDGSPGDWSPSASSGASGDEDPKMEAMANTPGIGLSLHDYLLTQFRQLEAPAEYLPYAESIVYSLDGRGFFPDPIETVIPDPTPTRVESGKRVLELIKSLDPPGIASKNEAECILRQLPPDDPDAVALHELLTAHWDDLIRNKLPRVAQATSRPLEEIERLRDRLSQFNIRPAARFSPDEGGYVMPDVVIDRIDGEWRISVDDDRIPRVRISPMILEMYKNPETDEETKNYLKQKIQGAMWLLEAVGKRHSTLYRVAEKLLVRQRDFFEHGIEALKPLKMQELATDLHIHVSTVSRAISDKWIQTPQGILPLKFFFAGGTASDDGTEESRTSVKQRVADVVAAEDTANPLSDDDIAEQLKQKYGLDVARRTVTKYRKLLKIASSRQRRRFA